MGKVEAGRKMHTFGNNDENNPFIANAFLPVSREEVKKKLANKSTLLK